MPRPKKSEVHEFVGIAVRDFAAELRLLGVPEEAVSYLAAAAYFYCPLPSVVQSAWRAALKELNTLSEFMARLQFGQEGPNPDYQRLFVLVRQLVAQGVGAVDRDSSAYADKDGNVCILDGVDGRIYAERPDRNRDVFVLLGVELLCQVGKKTKKAAFDLMVKTLRLLEGKTIAANSVKVQYRRAKRRYWISWFGRRLDLSRLQLVLSKPEARYVSVWNMAMETKVAAPLANKPSDPADATTVPVDAGEEFTRYKPIPAFAGHDGLLARWAEAGRPPNPDELPYLLAPSARARQWRLYDGSQNPPPAPSRGPIELSTPNRAEAKRIEPR